MLMPVEEDEKTEGHHESKRKKKNKGKLFFDGKNCLHGSGK